MSAHSFHAIGNRVVQDRRTGLTVERSTYDVAGAEALCDQMSAAIEQAKAAEAEADGR